MCLNLVAVDCVAFLLLYCTIENIPIEKKKNVFLFFLEISAQTEWHFSQTTDQFLALVGIQRNFFQGNDGR